MNIDIIYYIIYISYLYYIIYIYYVMYIYILCYIYIMLYIYMGCMACMGYMGYIGCGFKSLYTPYFLLYIRGLPWREWGLRRHLSQQKWTWWPWAFQDKGWETLDLKKQKWSAPRVLSTTPRYDWFILISYPTKIPWSSPSVPVDSHWSRNKNSIFS